MPDLTEEQACEKLDEVVEAVLWNSGTFMLTLEMLARACYSGPEDVIVRMTRLWYAYMRHELGTERPEPVELEEGCGCDVRNSDPPSRA